MFAAHPCFFCAFVSAGVFSRLTNCTLSLVICSIFTAITSMHSSPSWSCCVLSVFSMDCSYQASCAWNLLLVWILLEHSSPPLLFIYRPHIPLLSSSTPSLAGPSLFCFSNDFDVAEYFTTGPVVYNLLPTVRHCILGWYLTFMYLVFVCVCARETERMCGVRDHSAGVGFLLLTCGSWWNQTQGLVASAFSCWAISP